MSEKFGPDGPLLTWGYRAWGIAGAVGLGTTAYVWLSMSAGTVQESGELYTSASLALGGLLAGLFTTILLFQAKYLDAWGKGCFIIFGWAVSSVIGCYVGLRICNQLLEHYVDTTFIVLFLSPAIGGAVGGILAGAIGGLITLLVIQSDTAVNLGQMILGASGWAIGGGIGGGVGILLGSALFMFIFISVLPGLIGWILPWSIGGGIGGIIIGQIGLQATDIPLQERPDLNS